jgi:hypothetical protein
MRPKTLALLHQSNIKRRKFHSSRTEIREQNFKEAKKAYRKAIRIDIESYYTSKLKAADNDSKKIWSQVVCETVTEHISHNGFILNNKLSYHIITVELICRLVNLAKTMLVNIDPKS